MRGFTGDILQIACDIGGELNTWAKADSIKTASEIEFHSGLKRREKNLDRIDLRQDRRGAVRRSPCVPDSPILGIDFLSFSPIFRIPRMMTNTPIQRSGGAYLNLMGHRR